MNRCFATLLLGCLVLVASAGLAHASLILTSGLGTTHAGNLVVNGSFEIGAPPNGLANANFWADSTQSPYVVPPGWIGLLANNTARWGNDGPGVFRLRASDVLPDGRVAVDFHDVIINAAGAVPEPSGLALLLFGACALLIYRPAK